MRNNQELIDIILDEDIIRQAPHDVHARLVGLRGRTPDLEGDERWQIINLSCLKLLRLMRMMENLDLSEEMLNDLYVIYKGELNSLVLFALSVDWSVSLGNEH